MVRKQDRNFETNMGLWADVPCLYLLCYHLAQQEIHTLLSAQHLTRNVTLSICSK